VTAFDQLHSALQHHIVNSLGWRELRPLQQESIVQILARRHAIVLAPTAGGKTEAAFFPVLSRMLSENWTGLSVLYLCPIKALLNNLDNRLGGYCNLVGRRSGIWHGDVNDVAKRAVLRDTPDCLLTTPESLEVMLVSRRTDVVIIDEIHSFAGDDRGWHLLSLLERITRIAGREIQRIGLSATVGNPTGLLDWLSGHCEGERVVIAPAESTRPNAAIELDFVGNLDNAAIVISRLHRGEKRLVFSDSRSRAEQLAARLRAANVQTYVSHSSLNADERKKAEQAFTEGSDFVIVATSTLELGIDVGDLDRVIQIDAPSTVSSFLQRMGRTGRRSGGVRNCLFLATSRAALVRAAGLIKLWSTGYIEPVEPPPLPFHVLAQQIMALALQEGGIGRKTWREWIGRMPAFAKMRAEETDSIVAHMIHEGLLNDDEGLLWFGKEGECAFGRKNFMELLSVFKSPPLFTVRHGRTDLGEVHESSFLIKTGARPVLSLAGRSWITTNIDWKKRVAYVEPTDQTGRSRWLGLGQPLGFHYCQAIKEVLLANDSAEHYSRRAVEEMGNAREEFAFLSKEATTLLTSRSDGKTYWWTFAGLRANAALSNIMRTRFRVETSADNLAIKVEGLSHTSGMESIHQALRNDPPSDGYSIEVEKAIDNLKFGRCVPIHIARSMFSVRLADPVAIRCTMDLQLRTIMID
jgi:ATP-dependent helicase Lhr and Lhr-like helicase